MKRVFLLEIRRTLTLLAILVLASYGQVAANTDATSASAEPMVTLVDNDLHANNMDSWPDVPPNQVLQMQIDFRIRNEDKQLKFLKDQQDPQSPDYQRALTREETMANFAVLKEDFDAVVQWLSDQRFEILDAHWDDISYINFTGTVEQASCAFRTRIVIGPNGKPGDVADPSIPARFSGVIASVLGLNGISEMQNDSTRQKHPTKSK
jgi:subtilase family serine protease